MKNLINQGIITLQNDGFFVFLLRIQNYVIVKLKRLLYKKDKSNIEKWKSIKNTYRGKRIFIIGNGPSLNETPLYLLKDEFTMCFNRFGLMLERLNWVPNFYAVTDNLVIKDTYEEINSTILPIVDMAFFPDIHPSNVEFTKYINKNDNVYWLNTDKSNFSDNLPACGINKTVVNAGMQIAVYLGFTEIYLLGVDMVFDSHKVIKINQRDWISTENDMNHFDPRYFDKGRKYHNPTTTEMLKRFDQAFVFFESRGIKIYNAGIGGKLETFRRVDISSLFNFSDDKIKSILDECFVLQQRGITFQEIQEKAKPFTGNLQEQTEIIQMPLEQGCKLLFQLIERYIPIGPYKGLYYFLKRE